MLRYGFFPEFKSGRKILFWGGVAGIRQLLAALRDIASGKPEIRFDQLLSCLAVDGSSIILRLAPKSHGMHRQAGSDLAFEWSLSRERADDFAELVAALTDTDVPGHQYLECNTPGEITVMVSCNEYPDDLNPLK